MVAISIIIYKYKFWRGKLDLRISLWSRIEHWGILIKHEDRKQYLYHLHLNADHRTEYESKEYSLFDTEILKKVDYKILVGYSKNLTHKKMDEICKNITENWNYKLISNNCQDWVNNVLKELVNQNYLSPNSYEELKINNEITPLKGW
jgi:hypothetical protein